MTDQPVHTTVNRAELRRSKIAARLALPEQVQREASAAILLHLGALLEPLPAGTLGFCWPIRAEVDCRPLVEKMLVTGWRAVMPTVVDAKAPMEFRAWWPQAPMTTDPYGIPVPATAVAAVPTVLLLPLVAFDAAGFRLGYGGGYFDRTLSACRPRPFSVGVGFDLAAVADIHPEPHDVPLDVIVTESGIRRINRL